MGVQLVEGGGKPAKGKGNILVEGMGGVMLGIFSTWMVGGQFLRMEKKELLRFQETRENQEKRNLKLLCFVEEGQVSLEGKEGLWKLLLTLDEWMIVRENEGTILGRTIFSSFPYHQTKATRSEKQIFRIKKKLRIILALSQHSQTPKKNKKERKRKKQKKRKQTLRFGRKKKNEPLAKTPKQKKKQKKEKNTKTAVF